MSGVPVTFAVRFHRETQALGPLQEAAYRLIGKASCQIVLESDYFICHIQPVASSGMDEGALRQKLIDLVTDENLRAKIASETEGVRNVVITLAFGSLARAEEQSQLGERTGVT